ncbi:MAG TPA: hypothetical protein VMU34_11860 [Mycobacterium sp.]|nr:hypothetical protein [Mycobacterium sp.]
MCGTDILRDWLAELCGLDPNHLDGCSVITEMRSELRGISAHVNDYDLAANPTNQLDDCGYGACDLRPIAPGDDGRQHVGSGWVHAQDQVSFVARIVWSDAAVESPLISEAPARLLSTQMITSRGSRGEARGIG